VLLRGYTTVEMMMMMVVVVVVGEAWSRNVERERGGG
jgi:hypothetical protein